MRKRSSGANHWPHGRPRKRYKDKLKRIIISCNLSPSNWEEVAFYHSNWHSLSADGVLQFETSHITKAKAKREHSKTAENSAASSSPSVISVDASAVLALHLWATYPLSNISIICVLISNICARQLSSLLMDCNATQLSLATFVLAADADESHILTISHQLQNMHHILLNVFTNWVHDNLHWTCILVQSLGEDCRDHNVSGYICSIRIPVLNIHINNGVKKQKTVH